MEKLKLEHVSAYLSYGLKVQLSNGVIHTLGVFDGGILYDLKVKPCLRDLSYLTKPIIENGVEFVPIEKFEIGDDSIADLNDYSTIEYDSGNVRLINKLGWIAEHKASFDLIFLPYGVVQKLFEWKFNVFNLPENLYVRVTDEFNPYEK